MSSEPQSVSLRPCGLGPRTLISLTQPDVKHLPPPLSTTMTAQPTSTPINVKLLLIGNSSVGKSSLLLRFSDEQWLPEDESSATIGVDFRVGCIARFCCPKKNVVASTKLSSTQKGAQDGCERKESEIEHMGAFTLLLQAVSPSLTDGTIHYARGLGYGRAGAFPDHHLFVLPRSTGDYPGVRCSQPGVVRCTSEVVLRA